jgi:hypothetical protein
MRKRAYANFELAPLYRAGGTERRVPSAAQQAARFGGMVVRSTVPRRRRCCQKAKKKSYWQPWLARHEAPVVRSVHLTTVPVVYMCCEAMEAPMGFGTAWLS